MKGVIQLGPAVFPKERYLRHQWEFLHVRKGAVTRVGKFMVLKIADSQNQTTKVGIVVGKKCNRSAVKRNRARRLLRESIRLIANGVTPPKWIVIIARAKIENRHLLDVQQELVDLLISANAFSYKKNS